MRDSINYLFFSFNYSIEIEPLWGMYFPSNYGNPHTYPQGGDKGIHFPLEESIGDRKPIHIPYTWIIYTIQFNIFRTLCNAL